MPRRLVLARFLCGLLPLILAQRVRSWIYPWPRPLREQGHFRVRSITGSALSGELGDFHGHRFAVHGFYDWRNLAIAASVCAEGDTIVEVGANVGTETVGYSDIVGPSGRVIAFEPVPENVSILQRNLSRWRNQNTDLRAAAVADRVGRVAFQLPTSAANSGEGHLLATSQPSGLEVEVDCVTLDSVLEGARNIELIAIDVEGSEPQVLRGARNVLAIRGPVLVLEVSPSLLDRQGHSVDGLRSILTDIQYTPFEISRIGLIAPVTAPPHTTNWVCLSASRLHLASRISRALTASALLPPLLSIHPLRKYRTLGPRSRTSS